MPIMTCGAVCAALAPVQGRASGSRKKKKKSGGANKGSKGKGGRSLAGKSFSADSTLPGLGPASSSPLDMSALDTGPLTLDSFKEKDKQAAEGEEDGSNSGRPSLDTVGQSQLEEWFSLADYNGTAWISFREARTALDLERERFAFYDSDRDGRLRADEFETYYADSMRLGGVFVPPKPPPGPVKPPERSPQQLRNAYDNDLDGNISLFELGRLLVDYGRIELDANDVLRLIDTDRDELVNLTEMPALSGILHPVVPPDDAAALALEAEAPKTILDLFGRVEARGTDIGGTPYPPRILGPVPIFRRLDLDNDGFISTVDLSELLRPIQLGFRPHAVLGTLDLNGDGRLSSDEFEHAMVGDRYRD
ncbi:MAG: Ca2+-binding EF-hand superfamily protein [Planctomycetota bacterium]|jgi:Ca2+-binding EF-hand superfamily protein